MQVQVGISKQVCCQSGIQAIAGISIQMYRHFYLQASVAPGIGMPTLTGMTQASAPAQAVAEAEEEHTQGQQGRQQLP